MSSAAREIIELTGEDAKIFSRHGGSRRRIGDRQPSGGRGGGPRLRNLTFRYTRASVSMQSTKGESHDQNAPLVTPGVVLPRRGPLDPLLRASEAQLPDPFRNTGLEGGGWIRPFQPQNNEPTNWDVTIWPPANNAIPQGTWLQYQYREPDGTPAIFIQVGPGQWVNNGNGHQFAFVEIERRPDHVTLLDRSRGLDYQIRADGRGFWSSGGPWNYNAAGSLQIRH